MWSNVADKRAVFILGCVGRQGLDDTITAWTRPLARRSPQALVLTKHMLTGYVKAAQATDTTLLDSHLLAAQLTQPR
ncbi:hypothetical protein [Streptomyces sp. NPDC088847]|uniref:hypothetical protein n=1 Tax=Streptomyces sp. NPDC088847 TaxID=3365909 RepID=UPI00381080D3